MVVTGLERVLNEAQLLVRYSSSRFANCELRNQRGCKTDEIGRPPNVIGDLTKAVAGVRNKGFDRADNGAPNAINRP